MKTVLPNRTILVQGRFLGTRIFDSAVMCTFGLYMLKKYRDIFSDVRIFAYVLFKDRYILLVQPENSHSLYRLLYPFQTQLKAYYKSIFKSDIDHIRISENITYLHTKFELIQAIQYIHRVPLSGNSAFINDATKDSHEYPWSSLHEVVHGANQKDIKTGLVNVNDIKNIFGTVDAYASVMNHRMFFEIT